MTGENQTTSDRQNLPEAGEDAPESIFKKNVMSAISLALDDLIAHDLTGNNFPEPEKYRVWIPQIIWQNKPVEFAHYGKEAKPSNIIQKIRTVSLSDFQDFR